MACTWPERYFEAADAEYRLDIYTAGQPEAENYYYTFPGPIKTGFVKLSPEDYSDEMG